MQGAAKTALGLTAGAAAGASLMDNANLLAAKVRQWTVHCMCVYA